LLALFGAHHIFHVSRIRVKTKVMTLERSKRIDWKIITDKKVTEEIKDFNNFGGTVPYIHTYIHT